MDREQRNFSGPSSSRTETANNSDNAKGTSDKGGGQLDNNRQGSSGGQLDNNRQGSSGLFRGLTPQPRPFAHASRSGDGQFSSGVYNRMIPPTRQRQHGDNDNTDDIIKSIVSFFFAVITE